MPSQPAGPPDSAMIGGNVRLGEMPRAALASLRDTFGRERRVPFGGGAWAAVSAAFGKFLPPSASARYAQAVTAGVNGTAKPKPANAPDLSSLGQFEI